MLLTPSAMPQLGTAHLSARRLGASLGAMSAGSGRLSAKSGEPTGKKVSASKGSKAKAPVGKASKTRASVARSQNHHGRVTAPQSGRYTPPVPRSVKVSPRWVPVLMFALLIAGSLLVVVNYTDVLPGGASNWYLLGGIGLIFAGFITAMKYH